MDDPICYELRQDNACPHVAKTVRDFCSPQQMQVLPWPAYSPDMSLIEHVWDLVGRRLTRDPRSAAFRLCIPSLTWSHSNYEPSRILPPPSMSGLSVTPLQ
ncbi:hypothetical protein TNCV_1870131 [Trichonephila clavipes]|nr:hypothetical protein TNCV_1870131 [Trichonephila clavipes]